MFIYIAFIYLIFVIQFFICRLLNYAAFRFTVYSDLSLSEVLFGLVYGLRFDLSVITVFLLPGLLLLNAVSGRWRKYVSRSVHFFFTFVFVFFSFVLVVDSLYFFEVNRHLFDEPVSLLGDLKFTSAMLVQSYLPALLVFSASSAVIFWLSDRYLFRRWKSSLTGNIFKPGHFLWSWIFFFVSTVFLIRGGIQHKPVSVVDAFYLSKASSAQLALNGVFSTVRATMDSTRETTEFKYFSKDRLDEILKLNQRRKSGELWFRGKVDSPNKDFVTDLVKPNVFIFLLESFGSHYVDSFAGQNYGVTPFFDSLAAKSIRFPNFFAVGTRSIEGIQSILTSFPGLQGVPALGQGFEMLNVERLGSIASDLGYQSQFYQSAHRGSFRLNAVARSFGFDNYFGFEDFPVTHENPDDIEPVFGWDDRTFNHLLTRMDVKDASVPMLSFVFTGTAHSPFVLPPNAKYSSQHGRENEFGYLNTLNYTDQALKRFFEQAQTKPWFRNSVFILTADHTLQRFRTGRLPVSEHHRIPLIIFTSGKAIGKEDTRYGSQVDIFPTVVSLMGEAKEYSLMGDNLLGPERHDHALIFTRYGFPFLVSKFGFLQHNLVSRVDEDLDSSCDLTCAERLENSLLATYQYLNSSLKKNTWLPR